MEIASTILVPRLVAARRELLGGCIGAISLSRDKLLAINSNSRLSQCPANTMGFSLITRSLAFVAVIGSRTKPPRASDMD